MSEVCWEGTDLLVFLLCCLTLSYLDFLGSFPAWCLGKVVEFDCIGSWSLPFNLLCSGSTGSFDESMANLSLDPFHIPTVCVCDEGFFFFYHCTSTTTFQARENSDSPSKMASKMVAIAHILSSFDTECCLSFFFFLFFFVWNQWPQYCLWSSITSNETFLS